MILRIKHPLAFVFVIIACIFAFTVYIRLPYLERPISLHHEFLTATSLRTIQIWYEEGIVKYNFNPIMSYGRPTDKFINNEGKIGDSAGNSYYTSYPPFAFLAPYFIFKALAIYPSVLAIRVFNLALHFISAWLMFLLIQLVTQKKWLGILGAAAYLFMPVTLWFESNVYMTDMAAQPLFILAVYWFLRIVKNQEHAKTKDFVVLGLVNFLLIYTEWIGVLFSAAVFVYGLLKLNNAAMRKAVLAIVISGILSIGLTAFQYSLIGGFKNFYEGSLSRYIVRSGLKGGDIYGITQGFAWKQLFLHYSNGMGYFLSSFFILFGLVLLKAWRRRGKIIAEGKSPEENFGRLSLIMVGAIILLHHLIFFNFSAVHDFSVLKSSVLVSLLIPLIILKFWRVYPAIKPLLKISFVLILMTYAFYYSVLDFRRVNQPYTAKYKIIGEKMAELAEDDRVLFLETDYVEPQYTIYVKRNIAPFNAIGDVDRVLAANGQTKAVIFFLNDDKTDIQEVLYLSKKK